MNPATTTAAPRPDIPEELDRLITRAIRHQENLKLSDEAFVNRYKHQLKSVDTWVRTLKKRLPDRLTPRNYEKKLADLRHLVARIDGVETQETVYDLPIIRHA